MAVARGLFADKGLEGTSVEEIAAHAEVSKPVVYEHFGGKEGLYDVVVDREVRRLHDAIYAAISRPHTDPRSLIELGTLALLDYIEEEPDGFRIISRDSSPYSAGGSFQTILSSIASRVEGLLAAQFARSAGTRPISIRFDGSTARDLPWAFEPVQITDTVQIGERDLAFYTARNDGDRPITGVASFNVSPAQAGQ